MGKCRHKLRYKGMLYLRIRAPGASFDSSWVVSAAKLAFWKRWYWTTTPLLEITPLTNFQILLFPGFVLEVQYGARFLEFYVVCRCPWFVVHCLVFRNCAHSQIFKLWYSWAFFGRLMRGKVARVYNLFRCLRGVVCCSVSKNWAPHKLSWGARSL